jgi:hypothetical protein
VMKPDFKRQFGIDEETIEAERMKVHCSAMIAACNEYLHVIEHGELYTDGYRQRIYTLSGFKRVLLKDRSYMSKELDRWTKRADKANSP